MAAVPVLLLLLLLLVLPASAQSLCSCCGRPSRAFPFSNNEAGAATAAGCRFLPILLLAAC